MVLDAPDRLEMCGSSVPAGGPFEGPFVFKGSDLVGPLSGNPAALSRIVTEGVHVAGHASQRCTLAGPCVPDANLTLRGSGLFAEGVL